LIIYLANYKYSEKEGGDRDKRSGREKKEERER